MNLGLIYYEMYISSGYRLREENMELSGVKSLNLWKRLVRQSVKVDGSVPLERSLPPKRTTTMSGLYRIIFEIRLGQGWEAVISSTPNHSTSNGMTKSSK